MTNTTQYHEQLAHTVAQIETLMRAFFKAEGLPPIPFTYNGLRYNLRDRTERAAAVKAVADAYILAHNAFNDANRGRYFERGGGGEGPALVPVDSALLDRLADVLLYDELTDEAKNKVSAEEYPFLSERQFERRRGEEVGDKLADDYGSDRRNYREPKRRKRTKREHDVVDSASLARNKERAAQYKRDTATVTTARYNLRDNDGELTEPFVSCAGIGAKWRAVIAPETRS